MNILILGSGGREHAFAWKITQSPLCSQLFVAPGNAGTSQIATNLSIGYNDFEAIGQAVIAHQIELVVVGPEEPLVNGIVNYFQEIPDLQHVGIVGPDRIGAQLEGSKDFSKQFMQRNGVPTASSQTFTANTLHEGIACLQAHPLPVVLKADGLAAGKGVIIAETTEHAIQTLQEMLIDAKFGQASSKVVVEQFLSGIELSVFVLTDGQSYKLLPSAKDYKRIGEGDTGLNTGGMGAVSPVPFADETFLQKVEERIVKPTLAGLQAENIDYKGFIFVGLMNCDGEPYVIEYNARMGDPETEVVLPRIESDFAQLMWATAQQKLHEETLQISTQTALTTVVVAGGYPGDYAKGDVMTGFEQLTDVLPFHAGTKTAENQILTNGGRVMMLTGLGNSIEEARQKSQAAAAAIQYRGKYYRSDIGLDVLKYL
ncbi:MAG: phosphoribosylamine--glycine ligase [Spirosomataceae bacterium]